EVCEPPERAHVLGEVADYPLELLARGVQATEPLLQDGRAPETDGAERLPRGGIAGEALGPVREVGGELVERSSRDEERLDGDVRLRIARRAPPDLAPLRLRLPEGAARRLGAREPLLRFEP